MKFLSTKSFEHLLFELHNTVYNEIDSQLQALERTYPGALAELCKIYELNFSNASTQGAMIPASTVIHGFPAFDVHVNLDESNLRHAHKCRRVEVMLQAPPPQPHELGEQRINSNHLIIALRGERVQQNFIVSPLNIEENSNQINKTWDF